MLKAIPTEDHISRMYYELAAIGALCVGEKKKWPHDPKSKEELVALACDMSRYDPRLLGIVVKFFIDRWAELDPLKIRKLYSNMKTPDAVAVVCEFFRGAVEDAEAEYFSEYLMKGLRPVEPQFYFHNLYAPAGKLAARAVEEGLAEFKRWGFFACERPVIDQDGKVAAGNFDALSRMNIIRRLAAEKEEFSIGDYLAAVHHSISRQQALIDIRSAGMLSSGKRGRAAKWRRAA